MRKKRVKFVAHQLFFAYPSRIAVHCSSHSRSASAAIEDSGPIHLTRNHNVSAQQIHELAGGGYIGRAEPVIFIGYSETGETHLLAELAMEKASRPSGTRIACRGWSASRRICLR